MATKPTYEELDQRVKQLEKEAARCKSAEEALGTSTERITNILESISDGFFTLDPNLVVTYFNKAAEELLGRKSTEVLGRNLFDAFPEAKGSIFEEKYTLAAKEKRHLAFEVYFGVKPYENWYEVRVYPYEDGISVYFQVTTERKQAQEALLISEQRYRDLYENAPNAYFSVSAADGSVLRCNSAASRLLGYDKKTITGMRFSDLYADTTHGKYEAQEVFKRFKEGESIRDVELDMKHKNGNSFWISLSVEPAKDGDGNITESRSVAVDITERKQAQEAIKKSSEQIKLFAYSVSHDLKSPAIGLYGLTKLLHKQYRDVLDEKGKHYCNQILEAAEQIAALVDKINVYISTREMPLNIDNVELIEILQMVRDEFSPQLDIRQIRWLQPESMPEIRVDRLSILRILRNIVDNALKYGGDDLSEIKIGYEASDEFHYLSVSDDGVGVKGENTEKIFEVFQRHETARGVEGIGLGLAIVRELTEQHGGKVWVEPGPGKGTTFYVSISRYL